MCLVAGLEWIDIEVDDEKEDAIGGGRGSLLKETEVVDSSPAMPTKIAGGVAASHGNVQGLACLDGVTQLSSETPGSKSPRSQHSLDC